MGHSKIIVFDSSTKLPDGVLFGSKYQLGNFDECVEVQKNEIIGKYCLVNVTLENSIYFQHINKTSRSNSTKPELLWSICTPSTCSSIDIEQFLTYVFSFTLSTSNIKVKIKIDENLCTYKKPIEFTFLEITFGIVVISIMLIVILCTLIHILFMYYSKRNMKQLDIIVSFSLMNSVKKILISTTSDQLSLEFISGMKFLCMILILCGHSCIFLVSGPVLNDNYYKTAVSDLRNILIMNNPLMVDTFLFLSGFLMCRILIYEMDKRKGHVNVFIIYFARYLRLTPAYAIVLFFYCTLFKYLNNGPLWNYRIFEEQNRCIKSWWSNLLYINNYVNTDYICMFQSWYLAVDSQLFLMAPIFIYTLWYKERIGVILLAIGTFISALIPFMMTLSNKLDPTLMAYAQEVFDLGRNSYFVNTYIKTHMRATSYFFGLILGYLLHRIYVSNYELPKPAIIIGWMISVLCGLISLFSLNYFYQPTYEYNDLEAAIYSVFHRIGWCISIGWLIIACSTNNAGPIRKLLCWRPFIVLTRLTYCAYLTNGIILLLSQGTIRTPLYISTLSLVHMCTSQILLTFALALILCLFFESPIHAIEKILLQKYKPKLKDEDNVRR